MIRRNARVSVLLLAVLSGCGGAPAPAEPASWPVRLESFPFSGLADPASGRLELRAVPQAALQPITEDRNGTPGVAAPNTLEIYGATVSFAAGNVGYPAGCNPAAPMVMRSDVQVTSGFASQQLRNVYARITQLSAGPTFCTVASAGSFAAALGTYAGLYLYAPLDFGSQLASGNLIASASKRTLTWGLNLPSNAPYSFSGDLLAEVIPQPPTITPNPVIDATGTMHVTSSGKGSFTWAQDPLANGTDPEGFGLKRPTTSSQSFNLASCGPFSVPFNPANCLAGTTDTVPGTTSASFKINGQGQDDTLWWRARVVHAYRLPGETVDRTTTTALVFKVAP
jgi:hypothetical protein